MALELKSDDFQKEVLDSSEAVLVDFWAQWCGPCKMLAPAIEQLSKDFDGKAKVAKLDVDANPDIAGKYGVSSIPTVIVFKNGQVVDQFIGVQSISTYAESLNRNL